MPPPRIYNILVILERLFRLNENGTTPRRELLAGATTFFTMAYIIFVQPAILSGAMFHSSTGIDFNAAVTSTILVSLFATLLMGLYANLPVALAPGMGENAFFVLTVLPAAAAAGSTLPWETALGSVFWSGILFLILTIAGARQIVMDSVSPGMKNAIAAGIGIFIAFIGLENAGVIIKSPATGVSLSAHLATPDILIFVSGFLITAVLHSRKIPGSVLWGMAVSTLLSFGIYYHYLGSENIPDHVRTSLLFTAFQPAQGVLSLPASPASLFWKMDLTGSFSWKMLPYIFIFLFMDVFDTTGTLIAVSEEGGLLREGRLPRANRAYLSDAAGTVAGAALGMSTVTSYIESAAGVAMGGRTGMTAVTTAVFFFLALFFGPLIGMVGSYPPITAPALVIVGSMMLGGIRRIHWEDPTEAIPAFLALVGIPLTFSIADGMALSLLVYPMIKSFGGKRSDVRWSMWLLSLLLLVYFLVLKPAVG